MLPTKVTPPLGGGRVPGSTPPSGPQSTAGPVIIDFSSTRTASKQSSVLSNLKFTPAPVHQVAKSKSRGDREDSSPVKEGLGMASNRQEGVSNLTNFDIMCST